MTFPYARLRRITDGYTGCGLPNDLQCQYPTQRMAFTGWAARRMNSICLTRMRGARSVASTKPCMNYMYTTTSHASSENQHEFIRLRGEAFGLGCSSQMPPQFIITYHRYGALDTSLASASYTGNTLPDVFSTSSHHQIDHVAVQQQRRFTLSAIVQSRLDSTAILLSSTPLPKAGLWIA
ncbi:hypothetical protein Q7P35_006558 [Cladosporium inversicolor]